MASYNGTLSAFANSYEYVFTTVPVSQIQDEFYFSLKRCILSLFASAQSLVYVLMYVGLICAKLTILVFPHAVNVGKVVVEYHRTKLSVSDLLLEFTSITILLLSFIFRARIQRAYKNFINYVSAKSKVAAKMAPHVLFFTSALVFAIVGRNFLLPLTSSAVMPVFTLIIPLLTTIRVLSQLKMMDIVERNETVDNKMLLWVILSIYHGLVTLGSQIPFSARLLRFLPYVKEIVIVILIWVQLSSVFSRIVFESVISKILVKLCGMIPGGFSVEQTNTKTSTFFSILKMMYLVNDTQLGFLQALFQDSVATIIAVVFIFTPTYIATIGVVVIAMLLPSFRTAATVASSSASTSQSAHELARLARITNTITTTTGAVQGRNGQGQEGGVNAVYATHWLRYWVCLSVLWLIQIYSITMWPSVLIISTLWLQHSYFQGSSKLTAFLVDTSKAIIERNRRIQEENELLDAQNVENDLGTLLSPSAATKAGFSLSGLFSPFSMRKTKPSIPIPTATSSNSLVRDSLSANIDISTPLMGSKFARGSGNSKDLMERNDPSPSPSGGLDGSHPSSPVVMNRSQEADGKEGNEMTERVNGGPFSPDWETSTPINSSKHSHRSHQQQHKQTSHISGDVDAGGGGSEDADTDADADSKALHGGRSTTGTPTPSRGKKKGAKGAKADLLTPPAVKSRASSRKKSE